MRVPCYLPISTAGNPEDCERHQRAMRMPTMIASGFHHAFMKFL